jgi:hypothetical protein
MRKTFIHEQEMTLHTESQSAAEQISFMLSQCMLCVYTDRAKERLD